MDLMLLTTCPLDPSHAISNLNLSLNSCGLNRLILLIAVLIDVLLVVSRPRFGYYSPVRTSVNRIAWTESRSAVQLGLYEVWYTRYMRIQPELN